MYNSDISNAFQPVLLIPAPCDPISHHQLIFPQSVPVLGMGTTIHPAGHAKNLIDMLFSFSFILHLIHQYILFIFIFKIYPELDNFSPSQMLPLWSKLPSAPSWTIPIWSFSPTSAPPSSQSYHFGTLIKSCHSLFRTLQ